MYLSTGIRCSRPKCQASPGKNCITWRGKPKDKPHAQREEDFSKKLAKEVPKILDLEV